MAASIFLKILFVIVQVIFIVVGIVLIGLGAWAETQDQDFRNLISGQEFLFGPYLVIATGCAIVLVSIIGLVGALCETKVNKFLLGFYVVLVGLILVAQVAAGILGFVYRAQAQELIAAQLNTTFFMYGDNGDEAEAVTETWDFVQQRFNCCGIIGPRDWVLNFTRVPGLNSTMRYPLSCCINMTDPQCGKIEALNDNAYIVGCLKKLQEVIDNNLLVVAGVAVGTIVAELLVILMAVCILCFSGKDD